MRVYLLLLLLHTLAASFIWGINTLFLLDGGLSNAQAFAANAFFTAGLVLFEVPTGVLADTRGRRFSYLVGTVTLTIATVLYLVMWRVSAPFWAWALASLFLGLGFTFFSGAVQAWLVDALKATGFSGSLDRVFAKGEIVEGCAMLDGIDCRRLSRPGDEPGNAIHRSRGGADGDVRAGVRPDAGPGILAEARRSVRCMK